MCDYKCLLLQMTSVKPRDSAWDELLVSEPIDEYVLGGLFQKRLRALKSKSSWNFNVVYKLHLSMYGWDILCGTSKVPFEIPHKISNPYTERWGFRVENIRALRFNSPYVFLNPTPGQDDAWCRFDVSRARTSLATGIGTNVPQYVH